MGDDVCINDEKIYHLTKYFTIRYCLQNLSSSYRKQHHYSVGMNQWNILSAWYDSKTLFKMKYSITVKPVQYTIKTNFPALFIDSYSTLTTESYIGTIVSAINIDGQRQRFKSQLPLLLTWFNFNPSMDK